MKHCTYKIIEFFSHDLISGLAQGGQSHKFCQHQYNTLYQALVTLNKWDNFLISLGKTQKSYFEQKDVLSFC